MMRLEQGPGPGPSSPAEHGSRSPSSGTAIVVAGDEETRVLLRGLLRLHRYRVVAEADTARLGAELVKSHRPQILIADAILAHGELGELVAQSRSAVEGIRVVLVAPATRAPPLPPGVQAPDVVLLRPFRIRQFAEALQGPTAAR
jgi:DNA-binding NarL/FixJ family response regulator